PAPPTLREKTGADPQQLRSRDVGHGPLVEDVLPRQDRPTEPGLPQRVARALAVRDVQERGRRAGLPAAAGQIRRSARAVVERVACAAHDSGEPPGPAAE